MWLSIVMLWTKLVCKWGNIFMKAYRNSVILLVIWLFYAQTEKVLYAVQRFLDFKLTLSLCRYCLIYLLQSCLSSQYYYLKDCYFYFVQDHQAHEFYSSFALVIKYKWKRLLFKMLKIFFFKNLNIYLLCFLKFIKYWIIKKIKLFDSFLQNIFE